MTDRLDILYRQVDEESEKMTEDLLNNMINHNPKVEGSKHMLRERLREAVYNTSREICIKSKEQEIHRLNSMIGFIKSPGVKEGKTQKFSQESEGEANQFTVPHKTTKIPTPVKNPVLATKNKYQQLEMKDKETDTGVSEEHTKEILDSIATENKTKAQQEPVQRVRDRKIPPIVVAGKMIMTQATMKKMKDITKKKFVLEHKPNSTIVLTQTIEDHAEVKKLLEKAEFQFHTYTHSDEKTHAFILKGLDSEPDPEDVKQALIEEYRHQKAEKGKKKYVNAPDPGNIWAKRMQDRENQNSAREARQPGSGAQETQPIHNPPPNNIPHAQVGTVVSGGFANENSGQGIKALSDKFKTSGNLIDIPNMVIEMSNLIQEVQRTTDKYSRRRLLMNFFYGDCLDF
ncbi:hypothetical protein JTB14_006758 [Gonioctena quinquepunctata]|nr:hypothetical protein JTB14_006758 [Gonioctena quinquepunctata]